MAENPFFVITIFLLLLLPSTILSDIAADRAALLSLRSAVGNRSKLWKNVTDFSNPCSWEGVGCSPDNSTVLSLRLPAMGLSGVIPPNTISILKNLQTLSLRYNSLSGPFPSDISRMFKLRNLYLQHNFFNGSLPDFMFSLTNLIRLDLSYNGFSGGISSTFNNLTRLGTLKLDRNNFSGTLPDLNLKGLVLLNVSYNPLLTGAIPKGLSVKHPKSAFEGTSLCGQPLNDLCDNGVENGTAKDDHRKKGGLSGGAIAGIAIGSVLVFLILLWILVLCCRKRGKDNGKFEDSGVVKARGIEARRAIQIGDKDGSGGELGTKENRKVSSGDNALVFSAERRISFDLDDLLRASAEVLGKGTLGTSYKVILEASFTVSVKRLRDVITSEKEFRQKMEEIGKMNHQYLVPLIAYYYNKEEKLLVYQYLPLGSLSALLHGNKSAGRTPLNWETRLAIALGTAQGIAYLHSLGPLVSHGNIKSSNVLLTTTYEARLSDYCLAKLVGLSSTPNRIAGYWAPELTDPRNVSQKADIYSFGVLLLELLTGKAPTQAVISEGPVDLAQWVQSVVREEWTYEVFDLELLKYQNVEQDMVHLLQLAVDCTSSYPDKRPSMSQIINSIQELYHSSLQERTFDIVDDTEEKQE